MLVLGWSCGKWKPQRGSDWSHLWAKRTPEKKEKTNTDSGKHAKRLSQETGQQNGGGVCGMAMWEWAHSHGIQMLSKASELKADLPTSKLSLQIPSWTETSCKAPEFPWKFSWRTLLSLNLTPLSIFLQLKVNAPFLPLLGSAEGLWMLKMSLNILFHIQNQLNSGWRQSNHWNRELFKKKKHKTQNLVNSASTPTAEISCPRVT